MDTRSAFTATTNSTVVITLATVTAVAFVIIPYSSVHYRTAWAICLVMVALGAIAVLREIWKQYDWNRARTLINELLVEGRRITDSVEREPQDQTMDDARIKEWCDKVENVLRAHLKNEAYVMRFHQGGSIQHGPESMSVWKNNHRLETLATFLSELR